MARSWIMGSRPECDLMVDRPTVSGRHCRLTQDDSGFTIDDLGSSNGTFVNGERIGAAVAVRISRRDAVTLGPEVPMPWPPELAAPGARTLRIGREPDNEVVLNAAMISGHHARIVWEGPGTEPVIEDLGSSNGTALGSPERKTTRAVVSASDTVFLGTHPVAATQLLWQLDPSLVPTLTFRGRPAVIGRNSDCDQVFDLAMVSGRHARLVRAEGQTWIEDLGSSNGTFVNGQRITRAPLQRGDLVSLGTYLVVFEGEPADAPPPGRVATQMVSTPAPPPVLPVMPAPPPFPTPAPAPAPAAAEPPAATWADAFARQCAALLERPWHLAALLAQAPVLAVLIVLVLRAGSDDPVLTAEGWAPPAQAVAAVLFWLGLAAVWFGLSNALVGIPAGTRPNQAEGIRSSATRVAAQLAVLGVLGIAQCLVAWAAVASGAGLKGSWVPMFALLVITSAVGLALGLAVVAIAPRRPLAWAAVPLVLLPLWLFGGEFRPLPAMAGWARPLASLLPSRWAFEGLLLLEAERHPRQAPSARAAEGHWNNDLAEAYFPAETERMGVGADATALAAMLVGFATLAAVLAPLDGRVAAG